MRTYLMASMMLATSAVSGCSSPGKTLAGMPPQPTNSAAVENATASGRAELAPGITAAPGTRADRRTSAGDRGFFADDSVALDDEARAVLARQPAWLRTDSSIVCTIASDANERGTREYNLGLADCRANAVKSFFAGQGVSVTRLRAIAYGKEQPEVQDSDEQSHTQNRRAVLVVAGGARS